MTLRLMRDSEIAECVALCEQAILAIPIDCDETDAVRHLRRVQALLRGAGKLPATAEAEAGLVEAVIEHLAAGGVSNLGYFSAPMATADALRLALGLVEGTGDG